MDRRSFLKSGTALAALTASIGTASSYEVEPEAYAAAAAGAAPSLDSESGSVTEDELQASRQWHAAITTATPSQAQTDKWFDAWLGTAPPFSFRYGGEPSSSFLAKWQLHEEAPKSDSYSEERSFVWTDPSSEVQLRWQVKRFTDFPALEWTLHFKNAGKRDTQLFEEIQDLDLRLNRTTEDEPFILHGAHGGRYKPDDWWPFTEHLPAAVSKGLPDYEHGSEYQLGDAYPSSRRNLPFFNVECPESRGVIVGIGWTGNWVGQFKVVKSQLTARVGLKETHFILHPGEEVRTARIMVLLWKGRSLHGQNMLRRLLHQHYIPFLEGKPREPLVSLNTCFTHHGEGAFLEQANANNLLPEVQPFIKMGGEAFIIDAGWYGTKEWSSCLGDWTYSREKYPEGFHPLSDPLKTANVAFGIWFAPEMLNDGASLISSHPEWVRDSERAGMLRHGGKVLRLEIPEAREWFLSHVEELIDKQGMTLYRQDGSNHEIDLHEGEADNRKGIREIQYILGLYAIPDELRKRHPQLIMEAALGAPRIDLETLSRFHWHQPCESWLHPALDQCQTYGTSLWMPAGSLVFYNQSTDNYGLWSGFGGQLAVAWEPTDPDFPLDLARRQLDLYKRIRGFLSGDFYPLTPVSLDQVWMGYQYHRMDLNAGCAFVFKRKKSAQIVYAENDTFKLQLRGLAPGSRYHVRFESSGSETTVAGTDLAKGVDLTLGTAPTAELVVYKTVS
jgi:alpha-galactosidase